MNTTIMTRGGMAGESAFSAAHRRSLAGAVIIIVSMYALLEFVVRISLAPSILLLESGSRSDILQAIVIGVVNDTIMAVYLLIPVTMAIIMQSVFGRFAVVFSRFWILLLVVVTLIATIGDVFFWMEFESRPDRLVFHYIRYPVEVAAFLQEQFYIGFLVIPFALICWFVYRLLRVCIDDALACRVSNRERACWILAVATLVLASPFVFTAGPVQVAKSRHVNALASNAWYSVLHAAFVDETRWNAARVGEDRAEALIRAAYPPTNPVSMPYGNFRNVILVIEESFAGEAWTDPGKRKKYMPELSRWAERGIFYTNIYATGSRTTRGMEAIFHGYPPLPGIALTQRGGFERLPSLARELRKAGYGTTFLYGGWPHFSDFDTYWKQTGFDHILSKYDFDQRWFETSWGVADEILFEKLLELMDEKTRQNTPAFIATLTVSNHRPFDVPAGRTGFPAHRRKLEYAIAYADWALGRFLDEASSRPWYRDTLIVVMADHGPRPAGNATIPVSSYRIPVLMLGGKLPPGTVTTLGSSMDLPITLSRLLGLPVNEAFWGNDLLSGKDGIVLMEQDYHVGVFDDRVLNVIRHNGETEGWCPGPDNRFVPCTPESDMLELGRAVFQTAHDRFYRSSP